MREGMTQRSKIARGWTRHRRFAPKAHDFRYRVSMLRLDLAEVETVFQRRWLWSWNAPNLLSVQRRDHLRQGGPDLAEAVRELIVERGGARPTGPIELLTQPRYAGYVMNPISVYLVWTTDRSRLDWVVLEVHNTPWDQQIAYVLKPPAEQQSGFRLRFGKDMHVSPFMPMDMEYELGLRATDEQIALRLDNWRAGERVFSANLQLQMAPVTGLNLARTLLFTPLMAFQVVAGIYFEALRLYLKGVPYIAPPEDSRPEVLGRDSI